MPETMEPKALQGVGDGDERGVGAEAEERSYAIARPITGWVGPGTPEPNRPGFIFWVRVGTRTQPIS